jgi:hypothetical protein
VAKTAMREAAESSRRQPKPYKRRQTLSNYRGSERALIVGTAPLFRQANLSLGALV